MHPKQFVWPGYARKHGKKGVRNKLLVVHTVECSSHVARKIASAVGNQAEVVGFAGCNDNAYAVRMLSALVRHPNVGAVLAVGLGCEYIQPEKLAEAAMEEGKEADWLFIQDEGGTIKAIEKGAASARRMLATLGRAPRTDMGLADLVVGGECGGSDFTSGLAGNVVAGRFFDLLVDAGGTAIFEEILEAIGLRDLLAARGADAAARRSIGAACDKALAYCRIVRQYSISPGNFVGGLSTIEEKSMGAVIKSGSRPIQGVLKVGHAPPRPGLWLLDTVPDPHWMQHGIANPNDNEGLTALIASGCHIVLFITGRGNVVGNAVAPIIKVTGNSATFAAMPDDMDFDAGVTLSGETSQAETAANLLRLVAATAGGLSTKSETLGHCEYYIPYKYQDANPRPCACGRED
ncbi:MAG: UxaA family hydrolase [Planctomycetota bacterium]|jgi:altronate hydrolase|nr:UxaA family hydrolase [Planctomycetota bacterium]